MTDTAPRLHDARLGEILARAAVADVDLAAALRRGLDGQPGGQAALDAILEADLDGGAELVLPFHTAAELRTLAPPGPSWIVRGLLARGSLTELAAKIKAGKTRFALELVAELLRGRPFLGLPVTCGSVIYLTEEGATTFGDALRRTGLDRSSDLHVLFLHEVRGTPWPAIVEDVGRRAEEVGAALVIVDTLTRWAGIEGDAENSSGAAAEAMLPLEDLVRARDVAGLALRHNRKAGGELGDSARGSSAWGGAADILLSLRRANSQGHDSRRELAGVGRFEEVPANLICELNDGRYVALGDHRDVERQQARIEIIEALTPDRCLSETEIVEVTGVSRGTIGRALREMVETSEIAARDRSAGPSGRARGYHLPGVLITIEEDPDQSSQSLLALPEEPTGPIRGTGADQNSQADDLISPTPLDDQIMGGAT